MSGRLYEDELVFLAHSLALEQEAAERLHELAATMEVHHNRDLYSLLTELAAYSDQHADEVGKLCRGRNLPQYHAWEYAWPAEESPEVFHYAQVHYLMSAEQALQVALEVEQNAQAFYEDVAARTLQPSLKALAESFAREESRHVEAVLHRLQLEQANGVSLSAVDFDPANIPE